VGSNVLTMGRDLDKMAELFLLGGYKVESDYIKNGDAAMVYEGKLFIFRG
jgi:hypothetical protein